MSVWDTYSKLTTSDFRTLVAITAQVLVEGGQESNQVSEDLLQQSTLKTSQTIAALLPDSASVPQSAVRTLLEDEALSTRACYCVLEEVRKWPELAERIDAEFELRKSKMTGVELTLLAGALLVLALKIKRIKWGRDGGQIEFGELPQKAADVVKALAGPGTTS